MHSTYNEGKSVVAETFIRTLKNKLYRHMMATGKNGHSTITMKPIDVKNNKRVYIDEHNEKIVDLK